MVIGSNANTVKRDPKKSMGPSDSKGMKGYAPKLIDDYTEPVTGVTIKKGALEPLNPQTTIGQLLMRESYQKIFTNDLKTIPWATVGRMRDWTNEVGIGKILTTFRQNPISRDKFICWNKSEHLPDPIGQSVNQVA